MRTVTDLPLARSLLLLRFVSDSTQRPFFPVLLDATMRSLIVGYVQGVVSDKTNHEFLDTAHAKAWLRDVKRGHLVSLIADSLASARAGRLNAWRWIASAPDTLYTRKPPLLAELIDVMLTTHNSEMTEEVADTWFQILRRTGAEPKTARLSVCVQALRFAFSNTRLPLGSLVAESYYDVYLAVTESPTLPQVAAPLFGMFDWDKGKKLRRDLVASFLDSDWPPADLLLAVKGPHILRKIFKRLMRKSGGKEYAEAALAGFRGTKESELHYVGGGAANPACRARFL